jgi:RNA polymerase-binding transcription factor DksA
VQPLFMPRLIEELFVAVDFSTSHHPLLLWRMTMCADDAANKKKKKNRKRHKGRDPLNKSYLQSLARLYSTSASMARLLRVQVHLMREAVTMSNIDRYSAMARDMDKLLRLIRWQSGGYCSPSCQVEIGQRRRTIFILP